METQSGFWFLTVGLLAVLNSALAEDKYVVVGGNVDLRPPFTGVITNILWKHNGNLLAEWAKGEAELTYFIPFQGHTTLDITSGRLEVRNMTIAHEGLYTVDINNKPQDQRYDVKVIEEVPKPSILSRPLTCSSASTNCTLTCGEETKKAEPVTYSWKRDNEEWQQSMKDMLIIKTEISHVKTFTCRMKNPVSEKESEPKDNPLFSEELPMQEQHTVAKLQYGQSG
uniref:Ig-like domain-containing protein n=1 Tax=Dicentrarchus labrax TaxID=13489 RepID=A0A8C4HRU5_DICLA